VANVLIVDDDPSVRALIRRLVEREGHGAVVAETGRVALDVLATGGFDLVVTDINMPDVDGIELILAIRDMGLTMPIIAISGGGRINADSLLEDAKAFGAVEVLAKPFHLAEAREVIARCLAR
jgi:CheY-like chemotaxis protein